MIPWPNRAVQVAEHTPLRFREVVVLTALAESKGVDNETLIRMIFEAFEVDGRREVALHWVYSCIAMGKHTCR